MPGRPSPGGQGDGLAGFELGGAVAGGTPALLSGPPGPQGVVEQELHHVVLGEELGDGGQLPGADLDAGLVDLVFALGLPELVGPAQGVVGAEGLGGQFVEQAAELDLVVGGQAQVQHRVVLAEDAGEGLGGEAAGQVEAVAGAQLGGQLVAFGQGHGDAAVLGAGVQQVVVGQEAGEEQPVPVLVGGGLGELVDGLGPDGVEAIPEGPAAGAEPIAQAPRGLVHVGAVARLMDGQVLQGRAGGGLGGLAGLEGELLQGGALVLGEGAGHGRGLCSSLGAGSVTLDVLGGAVQRSLHDPIVPLQGYRGV